MLSIGSHKLRNNVVLAPMAGVTDAPFRELAWRFGAGYVVGEMVTSRDDLWDSHKSRMRRRFTCATGPRAVQIAGADPDSLAVSARRHWHAGAEIVDINFGCPAKKVCRKAAGSALLRDPDLVLRIVRAAVAAVQIPVTVKMRTGWSRDEGKALEIVRQIEDAGIKAITVHGRTRECGFLGSAEHDTVAEIKARVSIPVFANGDIESSADASRVLQQTGCDGVMIGRAALGQPWLLGEIAAVNSAPDSALNVAEWTAKDRFEVAAEHVGLLHDFYGERGIRIARKHVRWYLQRLEQQMVKNVEPAFGLACRLLSKEFNQLEEGTAQLDCLRAHALAMAA